MTSPNLPHHLGTHQIGRGHFLCEFEDNMSKRIRTTRQARKSRAVATQRIFEAMLLRWSATEYRSSREQAEAWVDMRAAKNREENS